MKIESHLESLRESFGEVDAAIQAGLISKQRTIGFHTSSAAVDMLEVIFHQRNLIDPGQVIKHEWFDSAKTTARRFPFDFPHKNEILALMWSIETPRNNLCYGKRQSEEVLEKLIQDFARLKQLFQEVTGYEL